MVRVQLTKNLITKKPKASTIIVIDGLDTLVKKASSKFRIHPKKIRFFVVKKTIGLKQGQEIVEEKDIQYLTDDILIAVSDGEDYLGQKEQEYISVSSDLLKKIDKPPRYPYPGIRNNNKVEGKLSILSDELNETCVLQQSDNEYKEEKQKAIEIESQKVTCPNMTTNFCGIFPILEGNVLQAIRKAVRQNSKINEYHKDGFISFDYSADTIFPPVKTWADAIVRECRGLIISPNTGKVIARRFHKFFNINQTEETYFEYINFKGAVAHEKLDGCLVSPILLDNCELIWATRKIKIDDVQSFISNSEIDYTSFAVEQLKKGITPLFEFCEETKHIVSYPNKQLVLIALRDNVTGQYMSLETAEHTLSIPIPVVQQIKFDDIEQLIKDVIESEKYETKEGVVISLPTGEKYKLKSYWYNNIAKGQLTGGTENFLPEILKLNNSLKCVPSDKIWYTVLKQNDDTISLCLSMVSSTDAINFKHFIHLVNNNIKLLETELTDWVKTNLELANEQTLISIVHKVGYPDFIVTDILENKQIGDKIRNFLIDLAKQKQIKILEGLLELEWSENIEQSLLTNHVLEICTFERADQALKDHVVKTYLPRKISNMLGKEVSLETVITIPKNYSANEGKIKGMWEMFTKYDIYDLRIDLQAPLNGEFTEHNGSQEYALLLVQYGLFNNNPAKPHGSFAGILIPTNCQIYYWQIENAIAQSLKTLKMIKIKKNNKMNDVTTKQEESILCKQGQEQERKQEIRIFCDLDGVLADFEKGVFTISGLKTSDQSVSKMWQRIASSDKFFENLDFMPDGYNLWMSVLEINCKVSSKLPTLLTGVPSSNNKRHEIEKKNWCKKKLGDEFEVITCNSADKYKYAKQNYILIDDRIKNGIEWKRSGGIFIHHTNNLRTIYELKKHAGLLEKMKVDKQHPCTDKNPIQIFSPCIVVDKFPKINDKIIAIDSEWNTKRTEETSVSIFQIGTADNIFIIDYINCNDVVREQLEKLLLDESVIKLCWGISRPEINKIGYQINSCIDLQEICGDNFELLSSNLVPSLSSTVEHLTGYKFNKSKEIQVSDWSNRPLSQEQLQYASNDVAILFQLHKKMKDVLKDILTDIPIKNIVNDLPDNKIKIKNTDLELNKPAKNHYAGIFLSEQSKKELLKTIKPKHKNINADHITLIYEPSEREIRGLPIGEIIEISVIGLYEDEFIQTAECICVNTDKFMDKYHITISTAPNVKANESNKITKFEKILDKNQSSDNVLQLFGTVGVQVLFLANTKSDINTLESKLKERILEFEKTSLPGQSLKFKPNELSPAERAAIHAFSEDHNIKSESFGPSDKRQLILTKKRTRQQEQTIQTEELEQFEQKFEHIIYNPSTNSKINENKEVKKRITDAYHYSLLKIIEPENNIKKYQTVDEYITKFSDFQEKTLLIMRGLPGSGKSSLGRVIKEFSKECTVCSADDYFIKNGEYKFDKDLLEQAHLNCYYKVIQGMKFSDKLIIVDNTNSTKSEYAKYKKAATEHKYKIVVLEINCENKERALLFANRNSHSVPVSIVLKMLARWEIDSDAIILEPIVCMKKDKDQRKQIFKESLQKWMSDKKLFHFNKNRNYTHMACAVNGNPCTYIDIPKELYEEFLERYVSSGIHGEESDEPKYIMEHSKAVDKFRMYYDIDYTGEEILTNEQILEIINVLQKFMSGRIYVTGCISNKFDKLKTGLHIVCNGVLTDLEESEYLCSGFVEMLNENKTLGETNWEKFIDPNVYGESRGLRMLGSRKSLKGVDEGRVYKLIFITDEDGTILREEQCDIDLIRNNSIFS